MVSVVSEEKKNPSEKDGGPYTKDERTKRQNEVARLHFEYGYSAVKIAEMMKVNRNTINSDIKYLYSNIKDELRQNIENFVLKQIGRLEAQRARIVNQITEDSKSENRIKQEKLLLDLDSKINDLLMKFNFNEKDVEDVKTNPNVSENTIRDFVLYLLIKYSKQEYQLGLDKDNIKSEIINIWQYSSEKAEEIFSYIENMGLTYCTKMHKSQFVYDLLEFAFMRRYVSRNDSFVTKLYGLFILNMVYDGEILELDKSYKKKHGYKSEWAEELFESYEHEYIKIKEKYAEKLSTVTSELLESISDQKSISKYIGFLNVFFAEKILQFGKIVGVKERSF